MDTQLQGIEMHLVIMVELALVVPAWRGRHEVKRTAPVPCNRLASRGSVG